MRNYWLSYKRTGDVPIKVEYQGTLRGAKMACSKIFKNTWNDAVLQVFGWDHELVSCKEVHDRKWTDVSFF